MDVVGREIANTPPVTTAYIATCIFLTVAVSHPACEPVTLLFVMTLVTMYFFEETVYFHSQALELAILLALHHTQRQFLYAEFSHNLKHVEVCFQTPKTVYLATFNVRTLKQAGQQVALARTLDSLCIDVCCLSETRTQDASTVIELTAPSLSSRFRLRTSGDAEAAAAGYAVVGVRKTRTVRVAIEKLVDREVKRNYQNQLLECLPDATVSDINATENISKALLETGMSVCGTTQPNSYKHWISDTTVSLLETR
ncbi:hypothetical protein T265_12887 [Opisthorchis viverrini]|uniref:Uncharacterized protein n=1 Tax=Opisthorchis viverrini TaxID=6198 RepID=A0A074ZWW4_OPIVI|nr:hypothetical protein T265_12887 [Opisthorchis viverrini]KER31953.1 hypothetical protein T265_12887 [Opisthorchis viverrini]